MCQNKTLRVLIATEDEDPVVDWAVTDGEDTPLLAATKDDDNFNLMQLSMFALGSIRVHKQRNSVENWEF